MAMLQTPIIYRGCHDRERMVVGFITTCAIRTYQH